MKVIIVDDEPGAISLLSSYVAKFTEFELLATFRNGLKALEFLNKESVDLVFLDINMPHLNGLSLSKMLPDTTKVIFTTAYSEHAVESYEVNATDYLLKPITFERFAKAVSKLLAIETEMPQTAFSTAKEILSIKSGNRLYRLSPSEILFLEKEANYIHLQTEAERITTRLSIPEALAILPSNFFQVHKSFIVNLEKVRYLESAEIGIGEYKVPIGPQFRGQLQEKMGG